MPCLSHRCRRLAHATCRDRGGSLGALVERRVRHRCDGDQLGRPAGRIVRSTRRRGDPTDQFGGCVRREREAPAVGTLRRPDERWNTADRCVDHAPGGLRRSEEVSRDPQRARWTAHPVRRDPLRRGPVPGSRRIRRRDEQSSGWQRPRAVVGAGNPRAQAPRRSRRRLGFGRRRRRARRPRCCPRSVHVLRRRPGRYAGRQLRRLHGHLSRRASRRSVQGHLQRTRRQQHAQRRVEQRHRHGVPCRARPVAHRRPG